VRAGIIRYRWTARIAVIGTGSTGVQIVSALASRARVRHFQRTAQWIFPVENPAFSEEQRAEFRSNRDLLVYLQREPTYVANVERFTEGVLDPNSEQIQEIQKICQDNLDGSVADAACVKNCSLITGLVASA
jgi:cation diffusion facilitator CzcD-associated flavoprotein CzcO